MFLCHRGLVVLAVLLGCLAVAEPLARTDYVPTEDGTLLETRIFWPEAPALPYPIVLSRTPYAWRIGDDTEFAPNGFAWAHQATRGQWNSGGTYSPFLNDLHDGQDTVAWFFTRSWCNGRVALVEGSAKGTMTALALPGARLTCFIIRTSACSVGDQFIYQGGVYRKGFLDQWLYNWDIDAPELETQWRAIPYSDPYWKTLDIASRADEITAPGLFWGGYYDVFARGTFALFMATQYHGGPGARGHQRLIMLAVAHGKYDFTPDLDFNFHPNYRDLDRRAYELPYLQHYLLDADNAIAEDPAVFYYTVGDDQHHEGPGWELRTANQWPPFPPRETWYYLHADSTLDTTEPAEADGLLAYDFDPGNPVPSYGGQNVKLTFGPYDQSPTVGRADVLCFYSPPLKEPVETTGQFRARLFVSTDGPDTDFTVKVVDVYPGADGRQILLLDTIQRVKYRKGLGEPAAPVTAGEVIELDIDLSFTSWIFNTGHRIGVHISSSNYPRFDVNPNNGEDIPSDAAARVAHNTIHLSRAYPSAVSLPVRLTGLDTDGDGTDDETEWDSPDGDMDGDGLGDIDEYYHWKTKVFVKDSDGDGVEDGAEAAALSNPNDAAFFPGSPLTRRHVADRNNDWRFDLGELLRVVQIYNMGGYRCAAAGEYSEDGYTAEPGDYTSCTAHDSDYDGGPDGRIILRELLRLVQFFNARGYHACPAGGTEDGFCTGVPAIPGAFE